MKSRGQRPPARAVEDPSRAATDEPPAALAGAAPAPLAALPRLGPDRAAAYIAGLQRGHGNAAVSRMLSRAPDKKPPAPGSAEAKAYGKQLDGRVRAVNARATDGIKSIGAAQFGSRKKVRGARSDLPGVADVYAEAYKSFEDVLGAGKARQELWDGLVMNVLIGVGVGLVAGAVVPLGLTAKAAATFGAKVLEGVVAEHASWALGEKLEDPAKKGELPMPPHPLSKRVEALEKVEAVDAGLLDLGRHLEFMADLVLACAQAARDCDEVADDGRHSTMTIEQLEQGVAGLEATAAKLAEVERAVAQMLDQIEKLAAEAARARKEAYPRRAEKHIWVHWMATLSPEANREADPDESRPWDRMMLSERAKILDSDPIEERLEQLGLLAADAHDGPSDLGWYVGANHTPDDSLAGTSRAHRLSGALKHVGKQGPLFANVLSYDGSAKEGKVSAGYIMPAGEKMLTVRVAPRAAVGENVIIHGVDADQGDPVLLARPTNRVETLGEQEFRRRTERAF